MPATSLASAAVFQASLLTISLQYVLAIMSYPTSSDLYRRFCHSSFLLSSFSPLVSSLFSGAFHGSSGVNFSSMLSCSSSGSLRLAFRNMVATIFATRALDMMKCGQTIYIATAPRTASTSGTTPQPPRDLRDLLKAEPFIQAAPKPAKLRLRLHWIPSWCACLLLDQALFLPTADHLAELPLPSLLWLPSSGLSEADALALLVPLLPLSPAHQDQPQ